MTAKPLSQSSLWCERILTFYSCFQESKMTFKVLLLQRKATIFLYDKGTQSLLIRGAHFMPLRYATSMPGLGKNHAKSCRNELGSQWEEKVTVLWEPFLLPVCQVGGILLLLQPGDVDICRLASLTCAATVCGPLNETISYAVLYSCTNSEHAELKPSISF